MKSHRDLNIYLIPGMGADERLYRDITVDAGNVHALNWKPHGSSRSLTEYAHVMAAAIKTDNNVIVGSSMGGMVAIEMSRIVKPVSTILLSAPTGRHEFPTFLKLFDTLGIHRMLNPGQLMKLSQLADTFMGFQSREHRDIFYEMLRRNGSDFLHFSVGAVLGWQNVEPPHGDFIQIIGDRDRLFKEWRMKNPILLECSGHFATYEKAGELSHLINNYLRKKIMEIA